MPPPLLSLGLSLPRKVALLVDRCLAKEPAQRPASAEALAEQLGLALEHRREMPAALRAFVKRTGRLNGVGTFITSMGLLAGSALVSWFLGYDAAVGSFVLGMVAAPFAHFIAVARRLRLLGYVHADIGPAFRAELEQAREEHAIEYDQRRSRLERLLKIGAGVSGTIFAVSGATAISLIIKHAYNDLPAILYALISFSGPLAVVSTLGYVALLQRRKDVDTEFWSKVWMGRIGKLAFTIAGKLLGSRAVGSAVTHRATELSLGMAAEQLYETLPKEARVALRDLPDLVRRLQHDAQLLRKRYDDLNEALGASRDAALSDNASDLRADRDALYAKLGQAVGALETIRLNLLRIHAGSGTVEGLTTHIDLAAEVSAEVERMLAAQEEVERGLTFPREIAPSPA
jgi:hypothetical protein